MMVKPCYFGDEKTDKDNKKEGYKDIFYSNYLFII